MFKPYFSIPISNYPGQLNFRSGKVSYWVIPFHGKLENFIPLVGHYSFSWESRHWLWESWFLFGTFQWKPHILQKNLRTMSICVDVNTICWWYEVIPSSLQKKKVIGMKTKPLKVATVLLLFFYMYILIFFFQERHGETQSNTHCWEMWWMVVN